MDSKILKKDLTYVVFGKPTSFNNKFSIVHPEVELYEKIKKLTSSKLLSRLSFYRIIKET